MENTELLVTLLKESANHFLTKEELKEMRVGYAISCCGDFDNLEDRKRAEDAHFRMYGY